MPKASSKGGKKPQVQNQGIWVKTDIVSLSAFLFANMQTNLHENPLFMSVFSQIFPNGNPNTHARLAILLVMDFITEQQFALVTSVNSEYKCSGKYDTPEIVKIFEQNSNIEINIKSIC